MNQTWCGESAKVTDISEAAATQLDILLNQTFIKWKDILNIKIAFIDMLTICMILVYILWLVFNSNIVWQTQ